LAKNPKNISASLLLGDLYLLNKQLDRAVSVIKNQIKGNVNIAPLYDSLASIKLAQGDVSGAIIALQEGLTSNPDNIQLSLALAELYSRQEKYDLAVSIYEDLLNKNPRLDPVINNLSLLLSDHYTSPEKLKRAVQLSEKFKYSNQPYFKDTYAWALIKQGNIQEGLSLLKQLVIVSPDEPVFRYHLGVAHHKNGNDETAISDIRYALELGKKVKLFPDDQAAQILLREMVAKIKNH
jgi:tetratricopeptide (TPR) repeat protein